VGTLSQGWMNNACSWKQGAIRRAKQFISCFMLNCRKRWRWQRWERTAAASSCRHPAVSMPPTSVGTDTDTTVGDDQQRRYDLREARWPQGGAGLPQRSNSLDGHEHRHLLINSWTTKRWRGFESLPPVDLVLLCVGY